MRFICRDFGIRRIEVCLIRNAPERKADWTKKDLQSVAFAIIW